jgi:IclR family transcriptional regulator, acetate operon repressor
MPGASDGPQPDAAESRGRSPVKAEGRIPAGQVAVLHKALDLLECLAAAPLTAAEISKQIGVTKPTVYRLLGTLQSRGFIAKEPAGSRYMIGRAVHALGAGSGSPADLISLTRPFTAKLAATYGETVNVAVKSGDQILYVDVLQSGHRLRTEIPAGGRDHIHSTALGKAILAELPEGEARAILTTIDLVPVTPSTITAVPALLRQFAAIRQAGYAVDDEENETGSVCIASAIRGPDGRPVGAISISGPRWRIDDDLAKTMGAELVTIRNSLSDVFRLGGARAVNYADGEDRARLGHAIAGHTAIAAPAADSRAR